MPYPSELSQWMREVSTGLSHLSHAQAYLLAVYSYAVVFTQSCGISQNAYFLSQLLGQRENTVRQRLREITYEAQDKRGRQRREVEVTLCFGPLVRWVLRLWASPTQEVALALDATTLRQTFTVLSVSVLVGRSAIPVAWTIVWATQAGAWKPHWLGLLDSVEHSLPETYRVVVLTDRGLYAKWLFRAVQAQGWHPLMRVNARGTCVERATGRRWSLAALATHCAGRVWHNDVVCFQDAARLKCTLVVMWDRDQEEPWLLLTDLAPTMVSPTWYGWRMWIEEGFKALKSGGFHWERTRMTDPARAERLWLVLALAALRCAAADVAPEPPPLHAPPPHCRQSAPPPVKPVYPRLSVIKRGMLALLAAALRGRNALSFSLTAQAFPPAPSLELFDPLKTYP
jgi:hypothetical protein